MDIQAGLAGVDTDVDLILDCAVHGLVFLCLAIRARGPHDYSSYALKSFIAL